jgi:hypothetical protein
MLLPLVVAFLAVALGTALALGPRDGARVVAPIRFVALVAALVVIATHLLPEAFEELGLRAFVAFAAGIALPWAMETFGSRLGRRGGPSPSTTPLATLELSYAGLVAHRFGDGLSMGAVARASATPSAALGVLLALAAHIVPVTTVMIVAFVPFRGRRTALVRGLGLAVVTMGGVVVAAFVVDRGPKDVSPWISAFVAGLLLHLVAPAIPKRRRNAEPGPA